MVRLLFIVMLSGLIGCATKYESSASVAWTRDDLPYSEQQRLFEADLAICESEGVKVAAGSGGNTAIAYSSYGPRDPGDFSETYMQAALINSMNAQTAMQARVMQTTIRGCMYERGWHQITERRTAWENCINANWPSGDSGMSAVVTASAAGKCDRYSHPGESSIGESQAK